MSVQSISDYPSLQRLINGVTILFFLVGIIVLWLNIRSKLQQNQVVWSSASWRSAAAFMSVTAVGTAFWIGGSGYPWWIASYAFGILTLTAGVFVHLPYASQVFRPHVLGFAFAGLAMAASLGLAWADRMGWIAFQTPIFRVFCVLVGAWYAYLAVKPIRG